MPKLWFLETSRRRQPVLRFHFILKRIRMLDEAYRNKEIFNDLSFEIKNYFFAVKKSIICPLDPWIRFFCGSGSRKPKYATVSKATTTTTTRYSVNGYNNNNNNIDLWRSICWIENLTHQTSTCTPFSWPNLFSTGLFGFSTEKLIKRRFV